MKCYFRGCTNEGITKEHIPPKAFFPDNERNQLLTVKSCKLHNNSKSMDDWYVLAHICMNASPNNRAREIFMEKVKPQLDFNNGALRKLLAKNSVRLEDGSVKYELNINRFDNFFTALSYGIIFKSCGKALPANFEVNHIYPSLFSDQVDIFELEVEKFYGSTPIDVLRFGNPPTKNERIYTVEIFGISGFESSLTIVHLFFGKFKVVSMLSRKFEF